MQANFKPYHIFSTNLQFTEKKLTLLKSRFSKIYFNFFDEFYIPVVQGSMLKYQSSTFQRRKIMTSVSNVERHSPILFALFDDIIGV